MVLNKQHTHIQLPSIKASSSVTRLLISDNKEDNNDLYEMPVIENSSNNKDFMQINPKRVKSPVKVRPNESRPKKLSFSLTSLEKLKNRKECKPKKNKFEFLNHQNNNSTNKFVKKRLIQKDGEANIYRINLARRKFFNDYFNTIVDLEWKYLILSFLLAFLFSWLFFTACWYVNSHIYSKCFGIDCFDGLETHSSLFDFFLFSVETQQTIGYGTRAISSKCWFNGIILITQCLTGLFLECCFSGTGGVLFAKLSRPQKRTETLIFSELAVISQRDGINCFMCRIGDLRKSHIILAHVHMYIIKPRLTQEGEVIPYDIEELHTSNSRDCLLFMPSIIEHRMNEESALGRFIKESGDGFSNKDFEILVTLEGTVESTGASIQGRTSFLPHEIHWHRVFEPMIDNREDNPKAFVDFSKFNMTRPAFNESENNSEDEEIYSHETRFRTTGCKSVKIDLNANFLNENENEIFL